ncbi:MULTISPECIES: EmrA/EmrK family multidrug efflux transporter periplasmic adaptor subunit [Alphaproteobacteria]|jgi:membrane fusion protein (multidrug efflux system)|uniref:Membrane fusion protein, multidrug efflux system n=2 Tax=Novosphingobium TaxID=165696 RepID=A0A1U6IIE5_9SPHN|nr:MULTISPECIES: EmrA/EmrK family multidrug efflux transporter periplasmic adaptor subunit [Alphaproteobacteria]MBU0869235.1 EmrA/EmrK family multidrug efflux transporter periplasmic adaptor subunit [Alphaproteobacteria bacterium]MBB4612688.1 membrane fusion protein (multidrug efflux system) [Novosphingobium taihuense]MBU1794030.1 EmrA/EmrK family multidrug efflux transporter periplasmic adaptor subunit [Alphaproteobacteria bacterium]TAJ33826.1 MAG: EmrA/EmrK family multidrug efflux transporter
MSDTATQAAEVDPELSAFRKTRRTMWLKRLAIALAIAALAWGAWYVLVARNYVSTDNAYVNARMAQVTPLIAGSAIEVLVEDTQQVKAGDVLVRLDHANARIAVAQAEADLAAARRKFGQTVATNSALSAQIDTSSAGLVQAQARLRTAQAEFEKARIDLQRREAVIASGAISGEELTQARKAYSAASSALEAARGGISEVASARRVAQGQLAANDALVRGSSVDTDPAVQAARARLDAALLDLQRTEIRAPVSGVVSRLQIQVGQRLSPGQTIMTIVPIDKLYVDANFKEVQLGRVRPGMAVTLKSDLYGGDVVYHGKVTGLAGGTGSSMAIIPAQNATGNWIKTVQRLPVRIELDPAELRQHPLRVGLSVEVEIDVSGQ